MSSISLAITKARLWTPPSHHVTVPNHIQEIPAHYDAVAITDGKISHIGTSSDILPLCSPETTVIDAKGGTLYPGFTDCHVHFLDGGIRLLSVKLRQCKSKSDVMAMLKEHLKTQKPGSWVRGGDWDNHMWGGELPDKTWLDQVSPDNPIWVNRLDGHMYLANTVAMELAGINKDTPDVEGGEIIRFEDGTPTGLFKDNAMNLVADVIPLPSLEEYEGALEAAMTYVAERGVTKVHTMVTVDCPCGLWPKNMGKDAHKQDVDVSFKEVALYRDFEKAGKLRTRIRAALPVGSWERVTTEVLGMKAMSYKDIEEAKTKEEIKKYFEEMIRKRKIIADDTGFLQVGVLKAMIDGSLGTHTGAFLEDYEDTPGYKGAFIWERSILQQYILDASLNGLFVCVHAIGEEANRKSLDIFENVTKKINGSFADCIEENEDEKTKNALDFRFRIEHAQHIHPLDIKRFKQLNVVASMQLSHLADDGRWATSYIGEKRMQTSWPMKSLTDTGAVVALGSDWFVTEPNPLQGIYDAATRCTIDGANPGGLVPSEKVSVEEALIGYTSGGAFAAAEENVRGSLGVGMLGDLVLLDRHLLEVGKIEEIPETKVLMTVVGGKIVFNKLITF